MTRHFIYLLTFTALN